MPATEVAWQGMDTAAPRACELWAPLACDSCRRPAYEHCGAWFVGAYGIRPPERVVNCVDLSPRRQAAIVSTYDDIAEWYDSWVGTHSLREDAFFPAVEALMGDVTGMRICDLACGQGRVARHLANLGASVVGIDLSAKLLAIARRHEDADPQGIVYHHDDARRLDGVA